MTKRTSTKPALPQIKPAQLRRFHAALADWYRAHGRHALPWRTTRDAYPIWISEVMLQQTQVATVLARFYHPFLARFPTIEALALAPQQEVLKAWEGLGYYSRARNLHKAAQTLTAAARAERRNAAALPNEVETLLALPGIGRNTAHAILAFGHHQPVAILEANVKRVVARIFAWTSPSDAELWQGAELLLNKNEAFDYNQAMMDLGSLICTPRKPRCAECPANSLCRGQAAPESYPAPKAKKSVPTREVTITVFTDERGRYHLETRSEKLLGGLWGFPQTPRQLAIAELGTVVHVYTHFKLIGHVVLIPTTASPERHWFSRAEIDALPLSKLDHKVLSLIETHHSGKKKSAKSATNRLAR